MNLKTYLRSLSLADRQGFARRCETSLPFLKAIAYGAKPCSPELAVKIDRESAGAVGYRELCPEAKMDWTYIERKSLRRASA